MSHFISTIFRAVIFAGALSFTASTATAHPDGKPTKLYTKKADTKKADRPALEIEDIKLPSETQINDMIAQMPDMNALMGDMMTLMQDPKLREGMERSGKAFAQSLEQSGALETNANGMPDFNKAFAAMLTMVGDEKAMGGMLETLGTMAKSMEGLGESLEKQVPKKPVVKTD